MFLPAPGTLVAEKYQLESLLGEGGMGAVYRARHVLMDKPVALKWLRPELCGDAEARERLMREARSVARIHHPNVVQIFDVDSHDGALFLVMELLEGQTLADLIVQQRLSTHQVIELLISAMHGLAAAHERGIIHRDIKPENIFVVYDRQHPEGTAKLLDFGISKLSDRKAPGPQLTQTGHSIGTPIYMSVEQLTRGHDVDLRTDIYALGVVLYHALSGVLPFDGETFASIVLSIATSEPRPLRQLRPELPASLERIVMKAMARDREDRYRSVDELITTLRMMDPVDGPPSPLFARMPESGPVPRAYQATRTPGPPTAAGRPDPSRDDSLGELSQALRANTGRRVLIGLTLVFALGVGVLALLRDGARSALGLPSARFDHSVAPAAVPGGANANSPVLPGSTSPGVAPHESAPLPDVPRLAPHAAGPAGSGREAAPPAPIEPELRDAPTSRASRRGHDEPSAAHTPRGSHHRRHDEASASHALRAAHRAHDEASSPEAASAPAPREAPAAPVRASDSPSPAASSKRGTAGGLLRGDF